MEKKWIIKKRGDSAVVKPLTGKLGGSDSLAILWPSEYYTPAEAHAFFNPTCINCITVSDERNDIASNDSPKYQKMKRSLFTATMMLTAQRQLHWFIHF